MLGKASICREGAPAIAVRWGDVGAGYSSHLGPHSIEGKGRGSAIIPGWGSSLVRKWTFHSSVADISMSFPRADLDLLSQQCVELPKGDEEMSLETSPSCLFLLASWGYVLGGTLVLRVWSLMLVPAPKLFVHLCLVAWPPSPGG